MLNLGGFTVLLYSVPAIHNASLVQLIPTKCDNDL